MNSKEERLLKDELNTTGGLLRLAPSFVPRTLYPGMGRLGLKEYYVSPERGWICERWLASSVEAVNPVKVEGEGLSFISFTQGNGKLSLREALNILPGKLLGDKYAREHDNRFGVLTKVLDIGTPIPWHIHAREEDAKRYWKMNGKDEAYYFLDTTEMGSFPYSHIAVHPHVTKEDLIPILKRWNDDKVLDLSPAYRLNVGEVFHIFSGVPHAPGTALTLEIQEESDVYNVLQAVCGERRVSKDDMLRGLPDEEAVADLIDWKRSRDPFFYKKYHAFPTEIDEPGNEGKGIERWVFNPNRTQKFCGKETRVFPGKKMVSFENGAYLAFVWKGKGKIGNVEVRGKTLGLDELFVSAEAAMQSHEIVNTGKEDLIVYKIFGSDIYRVQTIYDD
ncbi:MAG: hypothetical protein ACUVQY_06865 [Thermoproteota archaeon]